ncbi:MAG TPA: glycosyltransferase family 4 protein [Candidatus Sulfotelmatobacter sp.]|nr:glycosyltransferase family 4 protein [Candidatus Sulfotelmatobacter sp.]
MSAVVGEVSQRKFRVLAIASHPVQYMAPILRRMAKHPRLDLHVAYCSLRGAEGGVDPEFGVEVKWDVPLLDGYEWTHVPNKGSGQESFWGLNNPGLKKLIREGNFDAVLCFVGYVRASFWIARGAAKKSGVAFLFGTDATTLAPRDEKNWKRWFKKIVWPRIFSMADQVIVPSSGTHDLMRSLGIPEERITLTPYSVDNDWWMEQAAKVDRAAERNKLGLGEDEIAILFCAKLQPWKRPMDLLRAFAKAQVPGAKLIFAGEGPLRRELEAEARNLGIGEYASFLGFVNQSRLPVLYKLVDLMILPSTYEPFAVVVNEAMCCGCPVMASDQVGAARDLVLPVAPDFVFPARNVDALAAKLSSALDRERLRRLREAAQAHIRTWSPERNIEATIRAIEAGVSRLRDL